MRAARMLAAAAAIVAAPLVPAAQASGRADAARHPAVAQVRAIYRDVTAAAKAGRLRKVDRTFGYCRPYEDTERTLYLDARGVVRSYHFSGGSDDSAAQRALYYDRDGKLRFVLVKAGAVNGTNIEHRVYLSVAGERVWETRRLVKGPGYTFPNPWLQEDLVADAKAAFDAKSPCE